MALTVGVNSYGSQAEADAYFADSLRAAEWAAILSATKDQGLIEATRILERKRWLGEKEVDTQDLDFPRILLYCNGEAVSAADSLEIIKTAQFEYAISLIAKPAILSSSDLTGLNNIKSAGAGPAKVEFFKPDFGPGGRLPVLVNEIIACFLSSGNAAGAYVSGACDDSSFTDSDLYGLTEGFK
jgi:hypothetical protein